MARTQKLVARQFKNAEVVKISKRYPMIDNEFLVTLRLPDGDRTYVYDTEYWMNEGVDSFRRGDVLSGVIAGEYIVKARRK